MSMRHSFNFFFTYAVLSMIRWFILILSSLLQMSQVGVKNNHSSDVNHVVLQIPSPRHWVVGKNVPKIFSLVFGVPSSYKRRQDQLLLTPWTLSWMPCLRHLTMTLSMPEMNAMWRSESDITTYSTIIYEFKSDPTLFLFLRCRCMIAIGKGR